MKTTIAQRRAYHAANARYFRAMERAENALAEANALLAEVHRLDYFIDDDRRSAAIAQDADCESSYIRNAVGYARLAAEAEADADRLSHERDASDINPEPANATDHDWREVRNENGSHK